MKKILISFSVLTALLGVFSCQTDESASSESTTNHAKMYDMRIYYDFGGTDYGCSGSGGNCLDDVEIECYISEDLIEDVPIYVPVELPKPPISFKDHVRANRDIFVQYFKPELIDGILNDEVRIAKRGSCEAGKIYVIFGDNDSKIISVQPFAIRK